MILPLPTPASIYPSGADVAKGLKCELDLLGQGTTGGVPRGFLRVRLGALVMN